MAESRRDIEYVVKARDEASDTFKRIEQSLKSTFGKQSSFGGAMEMLKGGGAVAGLSMAANALADISKKALDLKKEFQEGKKTAGEMAEELAKQVPVYGKIWEAGRNIRELIFGEENKQWWDAARASEAIADSWKLTTKIIIDGRKELDNQLGRIVAMKDEVIALKMELAGDKEGAKEFREKKAGKKTETEIREKGEKEIAERMQKFNDSLNAPGKDGKSLVQRSRDADKTVSDGASRFTKEMVRFGFKDRQSALNELDANRENAKKLDTEVKRIVTERAKYEREARLKLEQEVAAVRDVNEQKALNDRVKSFFGKVKDKVDGAQGWMKNMQKRGEDMDKKAKDEQETRDAQLRNAPLRGFIGPIAPGEEGGEEWKRRYGEESSGGRRRGGSSSSSTDSMFGVGLAAASAEGLMVSSGKATATNTAKIAKDMSIVAAALKNRQPVRV